MGRRGGLVTVRLMEVENEVMIKCQRLRPPNKQPAHVLSLCLLCILNDLLSLCLLCVINDLLSPLSSFCCLCSVLYLDAGVAGLSLGLDADVSPAVLLPIPV